MKEIFVDVDGTLYNHGKSILDSTIQAIRQARKNGHHVYLCSGRNRMNLQPFEYIGFDGYIASAGAYVEVNNQVLYKEYMDEKHINDLMKLSKELDILYALESTNQTFQDKRMSEVFGIKNQSNSEFKRLMLSKHHLLEDYKYEPIHKYCFVTFNKDSICLLKKYANEHQLRFLVFEMFSNNQRINGEINPLSISKAKGIEKILSYQHASQKDTIGIGDSLNDLEMIQFVDVGIAMGNAEEELKQYANQITYSVDDHGLYHAFKNNQLI